MILQVGQIAMNIDTLDIQTPGKDRCLNPQTSREVWLLGVPKTYSPGIWRILGCLGQIKMNVDSRDNWVYP